MNIITDQLADATNELDEALSTIDKAIVDVKNGDDGAHWRPEVIEAARLLFVENKPEFFNKRSELKKASKDSQITEWTKEVKGRGDDTDTGAKADELVALVRESSELFHNKRNECFATFQQEDHVETWSISSIGFRDWLGYRAYKELGFALSDNITAQVCSALRGIALYDGEETEVFIRCANCEDGYYIDLANDQWQVIKVTVDGYTVVDVPPIRFIRSSTATALPMPDKNLQDLGKLWEHVNIPCESRTLVLAFMLESWRPETPFALLALTGEQGSAKSSTHARIRQLTDPNSVPLRSAPKEVQDIFVTAANNWQASFENMSNLSARMQDALCTLSTGGGFAARKLYSDADESLIEVKRPCVINGISTVITRPDLIDRTVSIHLPKIEKYKTEHELDAAFERDKTAIFAGLLDLFSATLRELPAIVLDKPPRMADFAKLGEAIHRAMGDDTSFSEVFRANRSESLLSSIEASPAAIAVVDMIRDRQLWEGTPANLKRLLEEKYRHSGEGWPGSAKGLAEILRRMAPAFRQLGVEIEFLPRRADGRPVRVSTISGFSVSENKVHNVQKYTDDARPDVDVHLMHVNSQNKNEPQKHTHDNSVGLTEVTRESF